MEEQVIIFRAVFYVLFHQSRMVENHIIFRAYNQIMKIGFLILHHNGKDIGLDTNDCFKTAVYPPG